WRTARRFSARRPVARKLVVERLENRLCPAMALTPDGLALGLTFSTFATDFPMRSDGLGPFGVAFPSKGGVLVDDGPGNGRLFPTDVDGQSAASFPPVAGASYGQNHAEGMAKVGNTLYMNLGELNQVGQINDDGTLNHVVVNLPNADGMVANPITGH